MKSAKNPEKIPAGVSVVICCYNSAQRLPETLRHLARQNLLESIAWELIIVVDKDSPDDTPAVATRIWREAGAPSPLCVMEEARPGKSSALETGYTAARYETLVTVDDDNWLDPHYLGIAFEMISAHPEIGIIGGRITAAPEVTPPKWFPQVQHFYAVGAQGNASGNITNEKAYVAGAGMVLRKSAYEELRRLGFLFVLSGGQRGKLTVGEDTELCLAMALCGYQIWYDDRLNLRHFIPKGRLTAKYVLKLNRSIMQGGITASVYWAHLFHPDQGPLSIYWMQWREKLWWSIKDVVKALCARSSWLCARLSVEAFFHHCISPLNYWRARRHLESRMAILAKAGNRKRQEMVAARTKAREY